MFIRRMTEDDIPAVYVIEQLAHPDPWPEQTFHDCLRISFIGFVIEINYASIRAKVNSQPKVLGYAILSYAADEGHILNFGIHPNVQKQGYGTQLIQYIVNWAREQRLKDLYLEVRASNKTAIRLYERHGFVRTGVRSNYYRTEHGREDAFVMNYKIESVS